MKTAGIVCCCCMIVLLLLTMLTSRCSGDQIEYDLIHAILRDYDSSIRPSLFHNYTLNVTFGLALTQLIDVDERNMIITTNCWLNQNWIDHKLKWDPTKFNNIKSVHIPAEKIWKPDILLLNNADSWAKISSISTNAIVNFDGNVTWLSTVIFKSSCSINVRYFPFDEQQCDMVFASWTFHGYFLDIDVNSRQGDTTNYIKNGEWHLTDLIATKNLKKYSCCEEPYPEIFYRLIIRRRPLFYLFNMVFPCLLITLVAFLGFYLPPGCTEKVSIGITTLLSITVFLILVAESMPPTSDQLPLLGIYYAATIGIVSCSTAMSVITLNINNKGIKGKRLPQFIRTLFFKYLAKILCIELASKVKNKTNRRLRGKCYVVNSSNDEERPSGSAKSAYPTNSVNLIRSDSADLVKESKLLNNNLDSKLGEIKSRLNQIMIVRQKSILRSNNNNNSSSINGDLILEAARSSSKNRMSSSPPEQARTAGGNKENGTTSSQATLLLKSSTPIPIHIGSNNAQQPKSSQASKSGGNIRNTICLTEEKQMSMDATRPVIRSKSKEKYIQSGTSSMEASTSLMASATNRNKRKEPSPSFMTYEEPSASVYMDSSSSNLLVNSTHYLQRAVSNYEFLIELERVIQKQFTPLIQNIIHTLDFNDRQREEHKRLEEIADEWSDVARICDHILCYFFFVFTFGCCFLIFFMSPYFLSDW